MSVGIDLTFYHFVPLLRETTLRLKSDYEATQNLLNSLKVGHSSCKIDS